MLFGGGGDLPALISGDCDSSAGLFWAISTDLSCKSRLFSTIISAAANAAAAQA
ncbi:MAG: hypothetical protein IT427_15815 [Pirellulales bacterium]|nr:hypothetical protein [Pirellulales bacterium]